MNLTMDTAAGKFNEEENGHLSNILELMDNVVVDRKKACKIWKRDRQSFAAKQEKPDETCDIQSLSQFPWLPRLAFAPKWQEGYRSDTYGMDTHGDIFFDEDLNDNEKRCSELNEETNQPGGRERAHLVKFRLYSIMCLFVAALTTTLLYFRSTPNREYFSTSETSAGSEALQSLERNIRCFRTHLELKDAVHSYIDALGSRPLIMRTYGKIEDWCVSRVTNFSGIFEDLTVLSPNYQSTARHFHNSERSGLSGFNADLSRWDVSHAKDMRNMFAGARSFNSDLSGWDISNVVNSEGMFHHAEAFNSDLATWDTSNIIRMKNMFHNARTFDGNLSSWDVSSVIDFTSMFEKALNFDGDLGSWDTSNAKFVYRMFRDAVIFNQDISRWNLTNVQEISNLFANARAFNQDLNSWDVSGVSIFDGVFMNATSFNGIIGDWPVQNVKTMARMFRGATTFNQDISKWDTSTAINLGAMFQDAVSFNQPLADWNVSNVQMFNQMFSNATRFNKDISDWDVSQAEFCGLMFQNAKSFDQDLSHWNVKSVKHLGGMFDKAESFRRNLCSWGEKLENNPKLLHSFHSGGQHFDVFASTQCPFSNGPDLNNISSGPYCEECN